MNFKDGTTEYALTSDANLIFDSRYTPPEIFQYEATYLKNMRKPIRILLTVTTNT